MNSRLFGFYFAFSNVYSGMDEIHTHWTANFCKILYFRCIYAKLQRQHGANKSESTAYQPGDSGNCVWCTGAALLGGDSCRNSQNKNWLGRHRQTKEAIGWYRSYSLPMLLIPNYFLFTSFFLPLPATIRRKLQRCDDISINTEYMWELLNWKVNGWDFDFLCEFCFYLGGGFELSLRISHFIAALHGDVSSTLMATIGKFCYKLKVVVFIAYRSYRILGGFLKYQILCLLPVQCLFNLSFYMTGL